MCVSVCRVVSKTQPAVALKLFGFVRAIEETALKELHGNHSKDEHEEHVDDQDVQHILQRVNHTVKHSLQAEEGSKHSELQLNSAVRLIIFIIRQSVSVRSTGG